ncbi:MAG: hypothetical protein KatS3mg057_2682 [Herpetosiphonaceae bacterium]|nr:MAG: hypothetical protein KatS3mg057_2682 [Herpetosiphonaceae bacterium]
MPSILWFYTPNDIGSWIMTIQAPERYDRQRAYALQASRRLLSS